MSMKRLKKVLSILAFMIVVLFSISAADALAAPNISGRWQTDSGRTYTITQIGNMFTWRMPDTGQTGVGNIDGDTATAVWPFGSAEGRITTDAADRGIRIDWNNGVVFTRVGESTGADEPAGDFTAHWTLIGSQAREIFAGGDKLYGVRSDTGDLYEYSGSGNRWTLIGSGGRSYAVDSNGYIYGINTAGVWRYNATPMNWTQIGGPATALYAGGRNLFVTDTVTGDIYRYGGSPGDWTRIGASGVTFAVDDSGHLYGLSPSGVFRYDGTPDHWTQIGPAGSDLFAGGTNLFGTHASAGDLYRYNGSPNSWTRIGGSGNTFTVDGSGRVYGLSPTGVFRYNGTPEDWTQIGPAATDIEAGRRDLYGITADGNVWRYRP
ncbi:MAG: PQQ-like beta-propeller repeat protein [Deltaproteobacteria bacterium]|nr:PQQ-like beta-propeller repeat protein [Candidatus Zymogenaceae bacterium]